MNVYIKKENLLLKKIITGAVILFLLIVFLNIFQRQIRNSFYLISYPISSFFQKTGSKISLFSESFLNAKELKNENNELRNDNQKLLSEVSLLQGYLRENLASKEILDNNKSNNFNIVLAKNIGLDISNDFILLDKGLDDGISENMPVISSQKVLYGKIFKVYKNFSQVMLISNKNSVLNVKISQNNEPTKTLINGAVKGRGNLSIYLDLIPFDAEIKEGDTLTTSALDGIFPRDFLVGKITIKNKNDLKPFQTAEVQTFFDAKNIENLFIITDYKQEK